ncbi:MAG: ShlB/FhaC/HecB family hemolysin secretion/activation protein, partial [Arenimonas sp.]
PIAAGLGLALFSSTLLAANTGENTNTPELKQPDFLPTNPTDPFQLPPIEETRSSAIDTSTAETLDIRLVQFRGNTVIAASELEAISAPYLGRAVNAGELEELRQKLSHYYVDRGFVNSGALLAKDAYNNGTLTFTIIEGRLKAIRVRGLDGLDEDYVLSRLSDDSQQVLNINTLRERFQLLLDDPLFARINARLMPDARFGDAILDIDVVRARPYQFNISANNYRPPSIGSETLGLSASIRNLTGYGDYLETRVQSSIEGHNDLRTSLAWNMPLNHRGTSISARLEHGRASVIEEPISILDIKSELDSRDIGLSHVVLETLNHKFTLGTNFIYQKNSTSLLGEPFSFILGVPDGVVKTDTWRLWQEYSYRTEVQALALRSNFSFVNNNVERIAGLPPSVQPDSQYLVWLGQAQYAKRVTDKGTQLILRGSVQYTRDNLLPLDRMSIGGVYTVRGFRENQLLRDTGAVFNAELNCPLYRNGSGSFELHAGPFYDIGYGKNQSANASTLSSIGLFTKARWHGFTLDLAWAKRLSYPSSINNGNSDLQDRGLHFQVSYSFPSP